MTKEIFNHVDNHCMRDTFSLKEYQIFTEKTFIKYFVLFSSVISGTTFPTICMAVDANEFKQQLLEETLLTIPNKELAEQIADLRFSREYKAEPAKNVYVGAGTKFVAGTAIALTNDLSLRLELSGLTPEQDNERHNGSTYLVTKNNTSVGAYLDWYPTDSSFRLVGGVNINNLNRTVYGLANTISVNGKPVNLSGEAFNVEYKFPRVTPYLGIGFGHRNLSKDGWDYFGDLGMMLGKYDAVATTSIIGKQGVKASDLDAEMNKIRRSMNKWSFIPVATFGLSYRYD
jgi:hypothetical protein